MLGAAAWESCLRALSSNTARLVTSATDILLWDAAGLELVPEGREATEVAMDAARSGTLPAVAGAGFGPIAEALVFTHKQSFSSKQ